MTYDTEGPKFDKHPDGYEEPVLTLSEEDKGFSYPLPPLVAASQMKASINFLPNLNEEAQFFNFDPQALEITLNPDLETLITTCEFVPRRPYIELTF